MDKERASFWVWGGHIAFRYSVLPGLFFAFGLAGLLGFYLYRFDWLTDLEDPPFFLVYLICLVFVLLLFGWVRSLVEQLDRRFPWLGRGETRLVYQAALGLLLPMIALIGLYWLFVPLLPLQMRLPRFRETMLLVAFAILLLANLCYTLAYFYVAVRWYSKLHMNQRKEARKERTQLVASQLAKEELQARVRQLSKDLELNNREVEVYRRLVEGSGGKTKYYVARTGLEEKRYALDEIACFFKVGKLVFFQLLGSDEPLAANEKSLRQVHVLVGDGFRITRRDYLVNQKAITECRKMPNGKCLLTLDTPKSLTLELSVDTGEELHDWILEVVDILPKSPYNGL